MVKSLVVNKTADDYCRASACQTLSYAVIDGFISRESVMEFFGTLFTGEEADIISDFWGLLAISIYHLYPVELMDVINQAYEDELIMPGMIGQSDFEVALKLGKDKCLDTWHISGKNANYDCKIINYTKTIDFAPWTAGDRKIHLDPPSFQRCDHL